MKLKRYEKQIKVSKIRQMFFRTTKIFSTKLTDFSDKL